MIRAVLRGMGVALVASYCFAFLFCALSFSVNVRTPLGAAGFVLITSWFVLPLGALLGFVVPRLGLRWAPPFAAIRGFAWGSVCGIVCGLLISMQIEQFSLNRALSHGFALLGPAMGLYCGAWVAAFAYWYAKRDAQVSS